MTAALNGQTERARRPRNTAPAGLPLSHRDASRLAAELDALAASIEDSARQGWHETTDGSHSEARPALDFITADRVAFLREQAASARALHADPSA